MNLWVTMFCVFLSAGLGSALITPAVRQLAWKLGVVDKPSARRVNKKPIPRMGGVAIFFGLAVAMLVRYGVEAILGHAEITLSSRYYLNVNFWIVGAAFAVIFLTGLLDDIFSLKPIQKLAGQIIAASIAAAGGLIIGNVVDPFSAYGFVDLGWRKLDGDGRMLQGIIVRHRFHCHSEFYKHHCRCMVQLDATCCYSREYPLYHHLHSNYQHKRHIHLC